jgi:molybdopterin-guanine dinucleotide biosynthesis adapter protein
MKGPCSEVGVPVLGFAAASGTGKTTLLRRVIPLLRDEGLRIGLIKHTHHDVEMDEPGKDSFELRKAGASPVLLASHHRRIMIWDRPEPRDPLLREEIKMFEGLDLDLVVVEGFRRESFAKIEVHRPSLEVEPLCLEDDTIIALATDERPVSPVRVPILDLNDPAQVVRFIVKTFLGGDVR